LNRVVRTQIDIDLSGMVLSLWPPFMSVDEPLILLMKEALANGANDIFLMSGEPPRARIDGEVRILHEGPLPETAMAAFWRACGIDPAVANEKDLSWNMPGAGRLRVSLYHSLGRLAAVARPIHREVPDMECLGLPADLLRSWLQRRYGLILITGPTGSGKSTSVASCLDWMNHHHARHIVTLEDPIEFVFENNRSYFSQREITQDAPDFVAGLRSALRQSPDVLFLGEIRDRETALATLQAAETGHLVISTLHSSSVVESIDRICHLIRTSTGALQLLSNQLIGVLSQQLLPRVGGGLLIALEYFQNEAATRRWIEENRLTELQDHLLRNQSPSQCALLDYLVAATRQGWLDPQVARSACARPQDFDRAMRGILNR
jgi:pilus retraction protein PilT